MNRSRDVTLTLLRVVVGLLFFCPGALKMFGWFGGMPGPPGPLPPLLFWAALIEIVAGPLVLIGLLTRPISFLASGEMAYAYFHSHYPQGFWPIQNGGQPAVLFCFVFLFLAANGAGPVSVDAWFARSRAPASGREGNSATGRA